MSSKYSKKALRDRLVTSLAGGVKGKPHSSKEGREAAAGRKFSRIVERGRKLIDPKSPLKTDNVMTPLRTRKFAGGPIIKKIISKVLKPKKVDVDKLLKNLGDEIKAQPIPPKIQKKIKELQEAYPHHGSTGKRNLASKKLFETAKGKK